ncbi:DUF2267 domain-containing protein [Roseibacterium sp. SDUM158017]|uniref:DUF2267 domain-containing protein n=1 Tax=Roseicyclus salinarum TaxID=3036773 RepID=UPI002414E7D7|nr:DUF2267 domain-containing protein [Roseibacterium sp. SDUM158017]MDG4649931.1 DUF2267 domain-containing protein [Roseibacterium sp. SDUM158017]
MPMPWTYRHASREWRAFLDDVKEAANLTSDNMAYTAVDGVFHVFRARLTAREGLRFASVLPSVPRAIFVAGWVPEDAPRTFGERADMAREAQGLRPHHNLTPDNAIDAVARALWRSVRHADLDRVLATLPTGAAAFWTVEGADPDDLAPRMA